jgi:hypothetical protein
MVAQHYTTDSIGTFRRTHPRRMQGLDGSSSRNNQKRGRKGSTYLDPKMAHYTATLLLELALLFQVPKRVAIYHA